MYIFIEKVFMDMTHSIMHNTLYILLEICHACKFFHMYGKLDQWFFIPMLNFSDVIDFNSEFPGRAANAKTSGSGIFTGNIFWGTIWLDAINDSITYTHTYIYMFSEKVFINMTHYIVDATWHNLLEVRCVFKYFIGHK